MGLTNNGIIQTGGQLNADVLTVGEKAVVQVNSRLATAVPSGQKPQCDLEQTVFISYRRKSGAFIARAIFMDLRHHGYDVFMDVESIDSGEFETIIMNQISARAHFIVVLTKETAERFREVRDVLREEIEHAISTKRNIIPVMEEGFSFEAISKCLVGALRSLTHYNALTISHNYFDQAMDKLRNRFLKQPLHGELSVPLNSEQPAVLAKLDNTIRQLANE